MTRAEARGALRRMTLLCGGREQSALIIHSWDSSIPLRYLLNILTCPHLYSPHLFSTILSSPHPSSPHLSSSIFSSHFLIHVHFSFPHPSSPHLSSSIFFSPALIHLLLTFPHPSSPHLSSSIFHFSSPHPFSLLFSPFLVVFKLLQTLNQFQVQSREKLSSRPLT